MELTAFFMSYVFNCEADKIIDQVKSFSLKLEKELSQDDNCNGDDTPKAIHCKTFYVTDEEELEEVLFNDDYSIYPDLVASIDLIPTKYDFPIVLVVCSENNNLQDFLLSLEFIHVDEIF